MIRQIEDPRKTCAGGEIFVPRAIRALRFEQILDPMVQAAAGGVAPGEQTGDGPRGLGWRALSRRESAVVITGAAFAPATVGVLDGTQPFAGAQHMRLAVVLARGAQAAQRETSPVDVSHAPPAIPAAVRLLCAHQVIDAAAHRRMAETIAVGAERLHHAAG